MDNDSECPYLEMRKNNVEENRRMLEKLGLFIKYEDTLLPKISKPPKHQPPKKSTATKVKKVVVARLKEEGTLKVRTPRRSNRLSGKLPSEDVLSCDESDVEIETPVTRTNRENIFGAIEGVPVGTIFESRLEASRIGIHRPTVAGIHGSETEGCYSIALSGGYEDDVDYGKAFTYTGEGGRDLKGTKSNPKNLRTAPQSKDQELRKGNLALTRNIKNGRPVRVIRGYKLNSPYAPETGYRYDGLYLVKSYWPAKGKSCFSVFKYAFHRCDKEPVPWTVETDDAHLSKNSDKADVLKVMQQDDESDSSISDVDDRSETKAQKKEHSAKAYEDDENLTPAQDEESAIMVCCDIEDTDPNGEVVHDIDPNGEVISEIDPDSEVVLEIEPNGEVVNETETNGEVVNKIETNGEVVNEIEPNGEVVNESSRKKVRVG